MPVSKLIERDTLAIEASVISLAPLVMETEDGVMHETQSTPTEPHGLRGSGHPTLNWGTGVHRPARAGSEAASRQTRVMGENTDEPLWPHLVLLIRS